jgi:glycosyltransferase 2 family protein
VLKIIKDLAKIALFFGVGFVILYLVYYNQDKSYKAQCAIDGIPEESCSLIQKVISDFQTVDPWWMLLVLLFFNISNIARGLRWKMMLNSMGYTVRSGNAFFAVMIGYFANLGLPRAGEILRATTLAKYEKIRVEKVVGTIVLDRILDVLSMTLILLLALVVEYETIWKFINQSLSKEDTSEAESSWLVWVLLSIAVLGFILFLLRNKLGGSKIVLKIKSLLIGFTEGVKSIKKIDKPITFAIYTLLIWGMYFLMTWVCFFAFEPTSHLSIKAGLIVFVFGTLGVLIPSPGGMGTFHAMAVIGLSIYGISGNDAFSFANILFFSVQIGCSVLLGIISIIALPLFNKKYTPDRIPFQTDFSLEKKDV